MRDCRAGSRGGKGRLEGAGLAVFLGLAACSSSADVPVRGDAASDDASSRKDGAPPHDGGVDVHTSRSDARGSGATSGDASGGTSSGSSSPSTTSATGSDGGGDAATDARPPRDARHDDTGSTDAGRDAGNDAEQDVRVDAPVPFDAGPPALRYIGRTLTDGSNPDGHGTCTAATPCFEWSGTQVVARFTGATDFHLSMSDYGNYFDVYVDGVLQGSPIVGVGTQSDYAIATGLSASATHEVSLYKRTEASTNARTRILGYSFPSGGTLLSPAAPASRRIEVIGDSISCGYGVLGVGPSCTETPALEDHGDTYAALTAGSFGADLYTIASSGRGVYENVDGTMTGTIPDIYGLTLPYVTSGSPSSWDFGQWTPDAVVIDAGTNDFVGSGSGDPGQPFVTAYLALVQTVRQHYPDAWIFCTNGPILTGAEYTTAANDIQSVVTMLGDPKISFLGFPTQDPSNGEGCDGHPSATTHQLMATQLEAAMSTALGW